MSELQVRHEDIERLRAVAQGDIFSAICSLYSTFEIRRRLARDILEHSNNDQMNAYNYCNEVIRKALCL